jgi:circadian clock protein KaiC
MEGEKEGGKKGEKVGTSLPRVQTGIPGLDGIIEGGFERGSVNVIAGESGTGKSIFALQFLFNGAVKYGENGLYITFEEKKDKIYRHMARFGWDLEATEREKKLFVYEYSPQDVERFIKEGGAIESLIRNNKIHRLVLDSITSYAVLHESEASRRAAILRLLDLLKKWNVTALLTSEAFIADEQEIRARFGIEYLADSLINLYAFRKGDIRELAIEIRKMRGTAHSMKLSPMKITTTGIEIYPEQPFFAKSF